MNLIDLTLIVFVLTASIRGFVKGIISEVIGLLSLIIGAYIALHFSEYLNEHLINMFNINEGIIQIVSFTIVFVSVFVLLKILGTLLYKFTNALALGFINKIAGFIFAGVKVFFLFGLILILEKNISIIPTQTKEDSTFYSPTMKIMNNITPNLNEKNLEQFKKNIEEKKDKIKTKINSKQL